MSKIKSLDSIKAFVPQRDKQPPAEPGPRRAADTNTRVYGRSKMLELGISASVVAAKLHYRDSSGIKPNKSRDEQHLRFLMAFVNQSGSVKLLDQIDSFRSELSPADQIQYDAQLEILRADERIQLFDPDGNEIVDPALRDMVLRGMLAATFGPPHDAATGLPVRLEQMLDNAAALNCSTATDGRTEGIIPIYVYQHNVPIGAHYPGVKSMETSILGTGVGMAGGLATPDGGIAIGMDAFYTYLAGGENAFTHESGHLMQIPVKPADTFPFDDQPWPPGFPTAEVFSSYQASRLKGAPDLGVDITNIDNIENFPLLLNMFTQHPEELRDGYPDIYDAFVAYYGYDPLEGEKL